MMPRYSRYEQFLHSICLGLFDYLRKSGERGFVLSLSGGADSSACAVLVHRMLAYAVAELGARKALLRLGRPELLEKPEILAKIENLEKQEKLEKIYDERAEIKKLLSELMPHFLQTIYQSAKHSTDQSKKAAQKIAQAVCSRHSEVSIQEQVNLYRKAAENILGRGLQEKRDDLALQNIQARSRSPLPWLLANLSGSIFLCTANRSEAAVGYTTVDGDMAGGLAPIGGVDKSFILEWLSFMQKEGDALLGPIPELKDVLSQKPSAELRASQSDEDDLMPYSLLDKISSLVLKERKGAAEVYEALLQKKIKKTAKTGKTEKAEKSNTDFYSPDELKKYTARYFELFYKSQW